MKPIITLPFDHKLSEVGREMEQKKNAPSDRILQSFCEVIQLGCPLGQYVECTIVNSIKISVNQHLSMEWYRIISQTALHFQSPLYSTYRTNIRERSRERRQKKLVVQSDIGGIISLRLLLAATSFVFSDRRLKYGIVFGRSIVKRDKRRQVLYNTITSG